MASWKNRWYLNDLVICINEIAFEHRIIAFKLIRQKSKRIRIPTPIATICKVNKESDSGENVIHISIIEDKSVT